MLQPMCIMYDMDWNIIKGKWYKNEYRIIKPLGKGGIGKIYLAAHKKRGLVALKLSKSMLSITREYDTIKKYKDKHFVPVVYELDDWESSGETYHFFAMEYIKGHNLTEAMKRYMPLELKVKLFMIILSIISDINEEGLIYSDIKHENIMVDYNNLSIRFVDFGSLIPIGESIKEYTPLYDRYSWGLGSRTADLTYQVFSAAVLFTTMLIGFIHKVDKDSIAAIMKELDKNNIPKGLSVLILKALKGEIENCDIFLRRLRNVDLDVRKNTISLSKLLDMIIAFLTIILGVVLIGIRFHSS